MKTKNKLINKFTYVPRVNKDSCQIELYYIDEYLEISCYTPKEGISTCSREYYLAKTTPLPSFRGFEANKLFDSFLIKYNDIDKLDNIKEVLGKRLTPPTYKLVCMNDKDKLYYNQLNLK